MSHSYTSRVVWTGNRGDGTATYRGYDRTWDVAVPGKPVIPCSNDPLLGGDPGKMNPEDLLLSALSGPRPEWMNEEAHAALSLHGVSTVVAALELLGTTGYRNVLGAPETVRVTYRDGADETTAVLGAACTSVVSTILGWFVDDDDRKKKRKKKKD